MNWLSKGLMKMGVLSGVVGTVCTTAISTSRHLNQSKENPREKKKIENAKESSYKKTKAIFDAMKSSLNEKQKKHISEWSDEIWNAWIIKINEVVSKEHRLSVINHLWMFIIGDIFNKNEFVVKVPDRSLFPYFEKLMNGTLKISNSLYQYWFTECKWPICKRKRKISWKSKNKELKIMENTTSIQKQLRDF